MLRRDFFKAMAGVAAALTASTAIARPKAFVSADTSGLSAGIKRVRKSLPPPTHDPDDTLAFVRSILKECRVVGHDLSMCVGELTRCRITYRHDPNGRQTEEDRQWEEYLVDAKIINVCVSASVDEIDVTHLGEYSAWPIQKAVHDVEIEYIVVPK